MTQDIAKDDGKYNKSKLVNYINNLGHNNKH